MIGPDPRRTWPAGTPYTAMKWGMSHRRETYFNPKGSWHIDKIPEALREEFGAVVASVTKGELSDSPGLLRE